MGSIALQVRPPVVKVPVLSKAIVWQEARASRTCAPFSNIPYKSAESFPYTLAREDTLIVVYASYLHNTFFAHELIAVA